MKIIKILALCGIVGFLPLNALHKAVKVAGCINVAATASFVGYHDVQYRLYKGDIKELENKEKNFTNGLRLNYLSSKKWEHQKFAFITRLQETWKKLQRD